LGYLRLGRRGERGEGRGRGFLLGCFRLLLGCLRLRRYGRRFHLGFLRFRPRRRLGGGLGGRGTDLSKPTHHQLGFLVHRIDFEEPVHPASGADRVSESLGDLAEDLQGDHVLAVQFEDALQFLLRFLVFAPIQQAPGEYDVAAHIIGTLLQSPAYYLKGKFYITGAPMLLGQRRKPLRRFFFVASLELFEFALIGHRGAASLGVGQERPNIPSSGDRCQPAGLSFHVVTLRLRPSQTTTLRQVR
jgi:hypothetical protein